MPLTTFSLDGNDWLLQGFNGEDWRWQNTQQTGPAQGPGWLPATVPGSVQTDLWLNHAIPDPYFEDNSLLVEWAAERTWVYRKVFTLPPDFQDRTVMLRFAGVDYAAEFFLNGVSLGRHSGMYTPAVFDVTSQLVFDGQNYLVVAVDPAPAEQPQIGRTSRVRTHKSRMTYGWDFCPRLVHLGLWDSVSLTATGPLAVADLFVQPQLSDDFQRARVRLEISLTAAASAAVEIKTAIRLQDEVIATGLTRRKISAGSAQVEVRLEIPRPRLWWPNGHGDQPLYSAEVQVGVNNGGTFNGVVEPSDTYEVVFGLRKIEFAPNDTPAAARAYTLVVNGKPIYAKGWNWVPLDVQYGVERPAKLERLLTLAQRAEVNLLRVWGGGLIEKEAFYAACDRLGILVWQEFILSSSGIDNLPSLDPEYHAMLVADAEQIIPRKRNHPCLALWCGGNELMTADMRPLDDSNPVLAALQATVKALDPDRLWLPTSPSGPVFDNSLASIARDPLSLHDVHGPWLFQGLGQQQELYNQGTCLFHSEFGVEGLTNLPALAALISPARQQPVSLENPLWRHLSGWWLKTEAWQAAFGPLDDLPALVWTSQFLQAEGLRYAVEADRRREFQNSGSLPWQFNEPYPMAACTSAVDYYARPKPAYYAVAGAYQPLLLSARFATQVWPDQPFFAAQAWISNSSGRAWAEAQLQARLVDAGGQVCAEQIFTVTSPANGSTFLVELNWPLAELASEVFFLDLALSQPEQPRPAADLATARYIFTRSANLAPLLALPPTDLALQTVAAGDRWQLTLSNTGSKTALNVWLADDRPLDAPGYAYFSANYFCLFPGESRAVQVDWNGAPAEQRQISLAGWNTSRQILGPS